MGTSRSDCSNSAFFASSGCLMSSGDQETWIARCGEACTNIYCENVDCERCIQKFEANGGCSLVVPGALDLDKDSLAATLIEWTGDGYDSGCVQTCQTSLVAKVRS